MRRGIVMLIPLVACSNRCHHDTVRVDPQPEAAALVGAAASPIASATPVASATSESDDDDNTDACRTAHADATARYVAYCKHDETKCPSADRDVGDGWRAPDLDGDGIREIAWGWGPPPVHEDTHLYRGAPGCAVHIATLPGNADIKALPQRHEGYADILVTDTSLCEGMCSCTPDEHVFVFHAGAYHEDPKRAVAGKAKLCGPPEVK
jgi:hypothetical protein